MQTQRTCECGCGAPVKRRFLRGHNARYRYPNAWTTDENGDPLRICTLCGEAKPPSGYYVQADGGFISSMCRPCYNAYSERRRDKAKRAESRRKRHLADPSQRREWRRKWIRENREKYRAHSAVARAVANGTLVRPTACEECGAEGPVDGHHDDYSKQLDVRWLCTRCHGNTHASPRAVALAAREKRDPADPTLSEPQPEAGEEKGEVPDG